MHAKIIKLQRTTYTAAEQPPQNPRTFACLGSDTADTYRYNPRLTETNDGDRGTVSRMPVPPHIMRRPKIKNAPQVCCLATRLRGLLSLSYRTVYP